MRSLVCLVAACAPTAAPIANRAPLAQTWYARHIITGTEPSYSSMAELTLHRSGDRATLTIVARSVRPRSGQADWRNASVKQRTYIGSVAGEVFVLVATPADARPLDTKADWSLAPERTLLRLRCVPRMRPVAPSTAVRRRDPTVHLECGNAGAWSLPTQSTTTLTCSEIDEPHAAYADIAFGQPGIEYLFVDDDCGMQGSGLRMIAPGLAVHAFQ